MKFMHLGDLHLGRSLKDFDLIDDQKYILNQLIGIIEEKGIKGVLIAGDIYDRSDPSEAAVALFDGFLCDLAERGIDVYAISGNHDSDERLNFGSALFRKSGIHIASKFNGMMTKVETQDEFGKLNIYLLPFIKASQVRRFYPEETIKNYEEAVKTVIDHAELNAEERNIVVAHQFVSGEKSPEIAGSENLSVQSVGTVEVISADVFSPFDYTALGHIHSPQTVGRENIRYSGSPLKYSLSEIHNKKTVPVITMSEKGSIEIEEVPLKPLHEMHHIEELFANIEKTCELYDPEDFYYITLRDNDDVLNAKGILSGHFHRILQLDYNNDRTRALNSEDFFIAAENRTFDELLSEFYKLIRNEEISEEEMNYMRELAERAGAL